MFHDRKFYLRELDFDAIYQLVLNHQSLDLAYRTLRDYYRGKHVILQRDFEDSTKPNNKLIHNFPKLIVDNSVAYFVGKPVKYTSTQDIEQLTEVLENNYSHTIDAELAKLSALYGHAYEAFWIDEESNIRFREVSPAEMFMCYEPTIEEKPLCAVSYYVREDAQTKERIYVMTIYGREAVYEVERPESGKEAEPTLKNATPHFFGNVPVVEYISNVDRMGDFEPVLSLVDAYNICNSDSVNDINYLNDAYLMLKNLSATDPESIADMKNNRVMLVDGDGDAQWLVKNINDLHIENIKKRLVEDIHKFSMTPNISDEKFASNLSGVAISYKLNSLESKTAVKERQFTLALNRRIELICNVLGKKGKGLNPKEIYPSFTRNIPQNLIDIVSAVVDLQNIVPDQELLALLPFIDDPETAMADVKKQREEMMNSAYAQLDLGGAGNVSNSSRQANTQSQQGVQE